MWNLQVNTLKSTILKVPQAETRALMFNELSGILESMKGKSVNLEIKIYNNPERNRTRWLYVRGIISTAIEDWVELVCRIEESFYQTSLQVLNNELAIQHNDKEELKQESTNILNIQHDETEKRQYVLEKRVHKLKSYRDALYIQTYTLLCDFVENIVNIIESTDLM